MDPASAKLVLEIQLQDINDILDGVYEDPPEDYMREGYEAVQAELQQQLHTMEDFLCVFQILKEEYDDRVNLQRLLNEEKQAISDHELAMRLSGLSMRHPAVKSSATYKESLYGNTLRGERKSDDDEQWEAAKAKYATEMGIIAEKDKNEAKDGDGKKPNPVETLKPIGGLPRRTCNSCAEAVPAKDTVTIGLDSYCPNCLAKCSACLEIVVVKDTVTLKCQPEPHVYCHGCLVDLFKCALVDTSLFPPRCCKVAIPIETCREIVPKDFIKDFDLKVEELATPNPTYCADPACANFIQAKNIKHDIGTCVFCRTKTCTICKKEEHKGLCPEDPQVKLLMDAAKRSKWQMCSNCKNMVELSSGCFHMLCRCGNQFCYVCGGKWKKCHCPRAQEAYLTGQVAPENGILPDEPEPDRDDETLVDVPAPTAIVGCQCDRPARSHVHGRPCQDCGDHLSYVMECAGCGHQSCWRCINNRA
ncbi:hypothetical protein K491DRAFT_679106 [Lophiostoma macrostomum CBS 122681]|uniref:RBR-type E3 ubiquitin transferase n=1 Tax=Lophiostoma macrostomum CBS 122681 TaxID=1314788 RepID=A0A6A6T5V8_9PLEO|nr:hypothetical protein K491DRAFT_679106 [Lophiostoma macrostomum CBS 122681]